MFGRWLKLLFLIMIAGMALGCDEQSSKYEFSFESNGGSDVPGYWIRREDWNGDLPLPIRDGYFFEGWYLEPDLTTKATKEAVDDYSRYGVDLYAKWIPADQNVVLEHWVTDFDGVFILFLTQAIGGVYGENAQAIPMNDPGFTEITDHPDRVPTVMVLAEGTPSLKLYYSRDTVTITYYYRPGVEVQVTGLAYSPLPLRTEGTEHDRHVFNGWHYNTWGQFPYTSTTMPGSDLTVFAKWTLGEVTVTFVTNGGTGPDSIRGTSFTEMSLGLHERTGYTHFGWFEDPEFTIRFGYQSLDGTYSYYYPWEDVTLYAKWIGTDTIVRTIHWYEDNDGEFVQGHVSSEIVPFGQLATATPNTDYHQFHVYLENHPNNVVSGTPQPNAPVTLQLYYERMAFRLTVEHGFGGQSTVIDIKFNEHIFPYLPSIERTGYSYQGVQYTGTGGNWLHRESKMTPYDMTIRMIWAELWYKTTFVVNGGAAISPINDRFGSDYSLPVPTRFGHAFDGWYLDEALSIACPMTGTVTSSDRTLYAKWSPVTVTLTFETNGANAIEPIQVLFGSSYALPSPEKEGFLFGGWYRDSELTEKYIHTPEMSDLDLTLYAKWLNMTYMIHFDTMGGRYVQDLVLAPGSPLELPIPTRTGFDFVGWFDASLTVPFTGTVMPEHNLVLYAKWQLKQ